jgi:hypothetical protein
MSGVWGVVVALENIRKRIGEEGDPWGSPALNGLVDFVCLKPCMVGAP